MDNENQTEPTNFHKLARMAKREAMEARKIATRKTRVYKALEAIGNLIEIDHKIGSDTTLQYIIEMAD